MTNPYQSIVNNQRAYFKRLETRDIAFRKARLKTLKRAIQAYESRFYEAIAQDFSKSVFDTFTTELAMVYHDIDYYLKHLKHLAKPQKVATNMVNMPGRSRVYPEPLGCCLIIGAWNYPYQLSLSPAIAALAAANTVVLKPSELAPKSAAVMAQMVSEYFDADYFTVVEGGVDETTALLQCRFDKLFFTGSSKVGKIVYRAAAKQLTPVTLELGGKSPVVVSRSANIALAAKRVVWAKFLNAGQTCVAPDYVLIDRSVEIDFLRALVNEINKADYTPNADSYVQIVNKRHFERLCQLIDKDKLYYGGESCADKRYIEPTILRDMNWEDNVMQEEIFGPILPVLVVDDFKQAVAQIIQREKPLAAYLFSSQEKEIAYFLQAVSSGGACINDVLMHIVNPKLPFGGVGNSGIGQYHGKYGFQCFSHFKAVLRKSKWFEPNLKYPPYSSSKLKWIRALMKF